MSIFRRSRGGPGRVTVQEAAARTGHGSTASGGDAVLLDVREPHEWQAGHAPGPCTCPCPRWSRGPDCPRTRGHGPWIVICRSGNRSRQAADVLTARGSEAADVIGGMKDWAGEGLPVVDSRGLNGVVA